MCDGAEMNLQGIPPPSPARSTRRIYPRMDVLRLRMKKAQTGCRSAPCKGDYPRGCYARIPKKLAARLAAMPPNSSTVRLTFFLSNQKKVMVIAKGIMAGKMPFSTS